MKTSDDLRVVCLGGSAGGLKAYVDILEHLPADTGMAFVIVPHRAWEHADLLPAILSKVTGMPVFEAEPGMKLKANCVFLVPPQTNVSLRDGGLELQPVTHSKGWPRTLTYFLLSLAEAKGPLAVAVVLSGLDSDGSAALAAIKDAGGITFAQSLDTAQFKSMPRSAVLTGHVDYVLSPQAIAAALLSLARSDRAKATTA